MFKKCLPGLLLVGFLFPVLGLIGFAEVAAAVKTSLGLVFLALGLLVLSQFGEKHKKAEEFLPGVVVFLVASLVVGAAVAWLPALAILSMLWFPLLLLAGLLED